MDLSNSSGVSLVNAVINPSEIVLLCSTVVTACNTHICKTSPSAVVCDMECGESSNSASLTPIHLSKSAVALS